MSSRLKNILLITAVAALTSIPLMTARYRSNNHPPAFKGTDNQAEAVIRTLAPDYKPWFQSILEPASSEIESLLFALQAALGAGFIGYYAGYRRGQAKQLREKSDGKNVH